MNNIFETAKTIQEKRTILKEISKPLQELKKTGEIESVNDGLKGIYRSSGHLELKTLRQWNKEGKRIKKGEKALCLWGKPKDVSPSEDKTTNSETGEEAEDMSFYPICYVFSNLQIQ